jgi:hypothetical protein
MIDDQPPAQRYIEMRVPPVDWTVGKLQEFVAMCRLAGADEDTPFLPYMLQDSRVDYHYLVLRCDIDG